MPLELILSSTELSIRPSTFQSRCDTESTPNPENLSKGENPTNPIQNQASRSIKRTHSLTQPNPSFGSNERNKKKKFKMDLDDESWAPHHQLPRTNPTMQLQSHRSNQRRRQQQQRKALSPPLLLYTRIDSAPGNNFSKSSSAPDAYRIQSNSPLDPNLLHAPTLYSHPSMLPAARAECTSSVVIIGAAALEPKLPVRLTTNHGQSQLLQWLS